METKFQTLEKSVFSKDPLAVVQTLSTWCEADREAARKPFSIILMAYGLGDSRLVQLLDQNIGPDSPEVRDKREREGIIPMTRKVGTYDHELLYIAWLACFGIGSEAYCRACPCAPDYEAESAQIMADRNPEWIRDWEHYVTQIDGDEAYHSIGASYWARLFHLGVIQSVNDQWVRHWFRSDLPHCFNEARQATEFVLRRVAAAREVLLDIQNFRYQFTVAKDWVPVAEWLVEEGLLEHDVLLAGIAQALHEPLNQSERNGCVILAKAIVNRVAKCNPELIEQLQPTWMGLLSDPQPVVAGFGIDQLITLQRCGLLDNQRAVEAVPAVFRLKPKVHAMKAIQLLNRIGQIPIYRLNVVDSLCLALTHSNKDVQLAALDALSSLITPQDSPLVEKMRSFQGVIAATLEQPLARLIAVISSEGRSQSSPAMEPVTKSEYCAEDLLQRTTTLAPEIAKRFQLEAAIQSATNNQWTPFCPWQMTDLKITSNREPIEPITSVDELIEVTSQAVEKCQCGDTPDRIVDAIVRLCQKRSDSFHAKTDSLRARACVEIRFRPNRGIVGGVLGESFSDLIAAWLGVEREVDEEYRIPERYPMGVFLRQLAQRVQCGTEYPLLSTPTHQGGWISAGAWIDRLRHTDRMQIDFLEDDLVRSLLRIAPDGRQEAWNSVLNSNEALSSRFWKLAQFVLDLDTPNEKLTVDNSWPLSVWIVAIRARAPEVNLGHFLPESVRAQIPEEIWDLPDVFRPANFQFSVIPVKSKGNRRGLVNTVPMPEGEAFDWANDQMPISEMPGQSQIQETSETLSQKIAHSRSHRRGDAGFYTAKLNYIHSFPAPAYVYPYLATHWPAKLTWYWAIAANALSRRLESGSSVSERYDHYLLPLLQSDQYVELMAARALWIATVSKDANARSMAVEVWISIIADDRCDVEMIAKAWQELHTGGWMKFNRIADAFSEIATVSPQHTLLIALILESFLVNCDDTGRDAAKLLEILDECNERLGRKIGDSVRSVLANFTKGKAKAIAKSLLARENSPDGNLKAAIVAALESRISRAHRFINS